MDDENLIDWFFGRFAQAPVVVRRLLRNYAVLDLDAQGAMVRHITARRTQTFSKPLRDCA